MKKHFLLLTIAVLTLEVGLTQTNSNNLLGCRWTGSVEIFTSLNITSKTFSDIDTLNGVLSLGQGESTYDTINKRYFHRTNLGITVIDAQTGAIIDTIANPLGMQGIEYDPISNNLLGCRWTGSVEIFTSLNISTKTFTDIDTLNGVLSLTQGESTYDAINKRYFHRTNLGIMVIDAQTGVIIDAIANPMAMGGIEVVNSSNTGILYQDNKQNHFLTIYPNPFDQYGTILFDNPQNKKHTLEIYNSFGQLILSFDNITTDQIIIERKNLTSGLYFIQLRTDKQILTTDKLIIE